MSGFRTTLWSRLEDAAAGQPTALNDFARRYRPPVISFLRRRGLSEADAEDVSQEVFLRLLSRELLAQGDAAKGRFRNYLIGITLRVYSERRQRAGALKRGGGQKHVPLDDAPPPAAQAEFDTLWLKELVERALAKVEAASSAQHQVLCLAGEGLTPTEIGERTGATPGAVRVALHRGRKRLGEAIKEEVASYCSTQEEYEAELKTFSSFLG
ncbi:MAG: sigma-70 family RNA polymerase sigma factor [Planctomycetes bacterium]|nr:sigma-70 family RNA polymerase sigma factor [Planctomycetota bacterium]